VCVMITSALLRTETATLKRGIYYLAQRGLIGGLLGGLGVA
jgi:hypothetical protein